MSVSGITLLESLTPTLLMRCMPACTAEHANLHAEPLHWAMVAAGIDNELRRAAFLAQVAHESGQLRWVREIASGQAYEGRLDLGNTEEGDGKRFAGRGWLQITGRNNYKRCGESLNLDLISQPELLEQPVSAARASAWFWTMRQLNPLADRDQFYLITRRINGGANGMDERIAHWLRIRKVLGL